MRALAGLLVFWVAVGVFLAAVIEAIRHHTEHAQANAEAIRRGSLT